MKVINGGIVGARRRDVRRLNKSLLGATPSGQMSIGSSYTTPKRFDELRALANAARMHSWTGASVDVVARSVVGPGWKLVRVDGFDGTEQERDALLRFFRGDHKTWDNIKDYTSFASKIYHTVSSFRLFGQAAWELRYTDGVVTGFDVLSGYTEPNVDERGNFKSPAFTFYPWSGGDPVSFEASEIVYFYHPGVTGDIRGETVYESLSYMTIPADIYAATVYRELFQNVNSPYNGVWEVDESVSDEDFELFVSLLEERYSGVENFGRNPLVVRGKVDFKEIRSRSREDAPYLEGRRFNQEEISAATGVHGLKLGVTREYNKANMREARRDFFETVLLPLYKHLEDQIYNQVIVRLFGAPGWRFKFNPPDFTTALEDATIRMRYMQYGVYSPNDIREQMGEEPRPGGDIYYRPANTIVDGEGDPGANDDGNGPDDTGTGPSSSDPERVPTDETHPEHAVLKNRDIVRELKAWRKHVLRAMDGKIRPRPFVRKNIPEHLYDVISEQLEKLPEDDFEGVKALFSAAEEAVTRGGI